MDDDSKLTLHGLQQHYVKLRDKEKNRKLFDLLDALEFNQVRLPERLRKLRCASAIGSCSSMLNHLPELKTPRAPL